MNGKQGAERGGGAGAEGAEPPERSERRTPRAGRIGGQMKGAGAAKPRSAERVRSACTRKRGEVERAG